MIQAIPLDLSAVGVVDANTGPETEQSDIFRMLLGLPLPNNQTAFELSAGDPLTEKINADELLLGDEQTDLIASLAAGLVAASPGQQVDLGSNSAGLAEVSNTLSFGSASALVTDTVPTKDDALQRLLTVAETAVQPAQVVHQSELGSELVAARPVQPELKIGEPNLQLTGALAFSNAVHGQLIGSADHIESTSSFSAQQVGLPAQTRQEIVDGIQSMVYRGGGQMTVTLEPAELGKLEVRVLAKGKRVEVELMSDSKHARTALEGQLPDLKRALATNDFEVVRAQVRDGLGFDLSHGHSSYQNSGGSSHREFGGAGRSDRAESSFGSRTKPADLHLKYHLVPAAAGSVGRLNVCI